MSPEKIKELLNILLNLWNLYRKAIPEEFESLGNEGENPTGAMWSHGVQTGRGRTSLQLRKARRYTFSPARTAQRKNFIPSQEVSRTSEDQEQSP